MKHQSHILNASTGLLPVCFVVIGSLKLFNLNSKSYSDETAWVAASLLFLSTVFSYLAIRNEGTRQWQVVAADYLFLAGLFALMGSVFIGATFL
jgi:hypothetical protein